MSASAHVWISQNVHSSFGHSEGHTRAVPLSVSAESRLQRSHDVLMPVYISFLSFLLSLFLYLFLSFFLFTALHAMQTRYCDENSVCLSVCLSVRHTREL